MVQDCLSVAFLLVMAGPSLVVGCLADDSGGDAGSAGADPQPNAAGAETRGTSNSSQTDPGAPRNYTTACPPGDTTENAQGVCVASIRRVDRSLQEPFLAVDASDRDRIAIGVNAGQSRGAVDERAPGNGAHGIRLALILTTDGGETWTVERLPGTSADGETLNTVDPTLVWGENGTLHVAGQVFHWVGPNSHEITPFYTSRSADGAWSDPTTFETNGSADRPWLTRGNDGTLYLVWSQAGRSGSAAVAWSRDDGSSWQRVAPNASCSTAGPVRPTASGPLFACSGPNLYRLDRANGSLARIDSPNLGQGLFPIVLEPTPNRTVVLAEDGDTVRASVQARPGAGWSKPVDLGDKLDVVDGWSQFDLYAWETSDDGGVHVLLSAPGPVRANAPATPLGRPPMGDRHVAYAVLTPHLESATAEAKLQVADTDPTHRRLPPTASPMLADDDYYGLDLVDGEGWAAWTRDRGIDVTRIAASDDATANG